MQIVEIKNNLVKVSYDTSNENLILSGFVVIKDSIQSFIGQIIYLEADLKGNFAIVKLLFTFDDNGVITNYDGSVPNVRSMLEMIHTQELLELLPIQVPVLIGDLAQQKTPLNLDLSMFKKTSLICSERHQDNELLVKNFAKQLAYYGKKVLVFDLDGNFNFSNNRVVAGKDFKLPLDYNSINFIYEKGLNDASIETKALIQDVFLEVQNYVKTLDEQFIPFETFKNVVDDQYEQTDIVELVLLKNKLLKYHEAGIFAQVKEEFDSLETALKKGGVTVFDLSLIDDNIQRQMISYAYSLIGKLNEEIYVFVNINDSNSDKKLLKQFFMVKNAYSTVISPYSYKYLKELKQLSRNLILFAPIQQQNDFAGYNTFLSKLNVQEFVIYGLATHHLSLIVKLEELPEEVPAQVQEEVPEEVQIEPHISKEELLDEQIKKDVDEIYIAPKKQKEIEEEEFNVQVISDTDELTEEDLDFIDDLNIANPQQQADEEVQFLQESEEKESVILNPPQAEDIEFEELAQKESKEEFISEEVALPETFEESEEEPSLFSNVLSEQAQAQEEPPAVDILPVQMSSTPIVPIYSAEVEPKVKADEFEQGDIVTHPKYGKGVVEKLINYGAKTLCSINFDNVGRRLLDPTLAEIKKV